MNQGDKIYISTKIYSGPATFLVRQLDVSFSDNRIRDLYRVPGGRVLFIDHLPDVQEGIGGQDAKESS